MLRYAVVGILLAFLVLFGRVSVASAQPTYILLNEYTVNPTAVDAFRAAQKAMTADVAKRGAAWRAVLHTHFGPRKWVALRPLNKQAELDAESPMSPSATTEALSKTITGMSGVLLHLNPEMTMAGTPDSKPALYVVLVTQVDLDKQPQDSAFMREQYLPALKKGGETHFYTYHVDRGGKQSTFVHIRPIPNMASLDQPDSLERALGADGRAKIRAARAALYRSEDQSVDWHFEPDQSVGTPFASIPAAAPVK